MKVVTWNINGGYGLNPNNPKELLGFETLDYFTEQLKQIDADVVCLEVYLYPFRLIPSELTRADAR